MRKARARSAATETPAANSTRTHDRLEQRLFVGRGIFVLDEKDGRRRHQAERLARFTFGHSVERRVSDGWRGDSGVPDASAIQR